LAFRSSGPAFGFSGNNGDLYTVYQHIDIRNVLFGHQRQDQLLGATNFLSVPLGDLRANGFGGTFDGFDGDVQIREYLHRLAPCGERHLAAHHGFHAPNAR
jgi:hypothetical protein